MLKNKDNYTLTIPRDTQEVKEILLRNTLVRTTLSLENTVKPFIGKIDDDGFFIMPSTKPFIFCTLYGKFESVDGNTSIETNLQKAFFRLYVFAVVAMMVPVFMQCFTDPNIGLSIIPFMQWVFIVVLFHLLFHGVYILSRNQGIKEIERLLY